MATSTDDGAAPMMSAELLAELGGDGGALMMTSARKKSAAGGGTAFLLMMWLQIDAESSTFRPIALLTKYPENPAELPLRYTSVLLHNRASELN